MPKPFDRFFPVARTTLDIHENAIYRTGYEGAVGPSFLEYTAIEFTSSLLANPAFVGVKEWPPSKLLTYGVELARTFCAMLDKENPPQPTPPGSRADSGPVLKAVDTPPATASVPITDLKQPAATASVPFDLQDAGVAR